MSQLTQGLLLSVGKFSSFILYSQDHIELIFAFRKLKDFSNLVSFQLYTYYTFTLIFIDNYLSGNPLLDISAEVGPEVLTKYDLKAGNACLAEEKHLPL